MQNKTDIFKCQQCGYCCQGETTVSLDTKDVARMLEHLNMPRPAVEKRYWRITGDTIQMKTVDSHCIFYDQGCSIHQGKPWRCSQWPLHPSILEDRSNFEIIKQSCPGINQEMSYEKFCDNLRTLLTGGI
jgi:hypothetical protein